MRRFWNALPLIVIVLVLAAFGVVVWLTYHPETPWLAEAEGWPVVGPAASWLRESYLPPMETEVAEAARESDASGIEVIYLTPEGKRWDGEGPLDLRTHDAQGRIRQRLEPEPAETQGPIRIPPPVIGTPSKGARPSLPQPQAEPEVAYMAQDWAWFLPGNPLRRQPDERASVLRELPALSYLPVLERRGEWASVAMQGQNAWLNTAWEPPFSRRGAGRGLLRHRYEPTEKADWETIRRARKGMGIGEPRGTLGSYELFTDVEDEALLTFLDEAATMAEKAYFARYGRLPSGDPKRSVVLFAQEAEYRTFSENARVPLSNHRGHAGSGVVAMFVGDQRREELALVLVHEIAHLLNNRAVAWRLPPWLEEGIAGDLSSIWIENAPTLGAASLAGERAYVNSSEARLRYLEELRSRGKLPSVNLLWRLDSEHFYATGNAQYSYSHGALLVTFLIREHPDEFREFLKRVAIGQGPDPRTLLKLLDMEPAIVDQAFAHWLEGEARRLEEALQARRGRLARSR